MRFALLLLLFLAACATPRESCSRDATRDLAVLDDLIAESRINLARGYALEREPTTRASFNFCAGDELFFCSANEAAVRVRAVAIDPGLEERKLASLVAKRAQTRARTDAAIRACASRYGA